MFIFFFASYYKQTSETLNTSKDKYPLPFVHSGVSSLQMPEISQVLD